MRNFYPWQPFSRCWEPDEGMLGEIDRDGMVAWARREAFNTDVLFWRKTDKRMLLELETSDRARMYGYGSTRPLYLPEGVHYEGRTWARDVLPGLVEQAVALVNDPVALRSFEQRIGRDAEIIVNSFDGQTAHEVAHELAREGHPLHGALFRVVANDMALWLQQETSEAPQSPLTAFFDRGVMRTISKRMRLIREGLLLTDERPDPYPIEYPVFDEEALDQVIRIVLWGQNGLGVLLRTSMLEFFRERIFDLGSRWLFTCPEAGTSRVGLGYLFMEAFWQIVRAFDFCGFEPERADLWKLSLKAQTEPIHPFSFDRVDWGLIESWIFQHRYRLTSANWWEYDPVALYPQLAHEIALNHGDLEDELSLRAKEVPWESENWKRWGMQHENPILFDHEQRYVPIPWIEELYASQETGGAKPDNYVFDEGKREEEPDAKIDYERKERHYGPTVDVMAEQEERESIQEEEVSQDRIEWMVPVLYGLMERLHQAYSGHEHWECDHLDVCPDRWRDRMVWGLSQDVERWVEQPTLIACLQSEEGVDHEGYAKDLKAVFLGREAAMPEAFDPLGDRANLFPWSGSIAN